MAQDVDLQALEGYGTLLTEPGKLASLSRAYEREQTVMEITRQLQRGKTRAVLLLGPGGVGKTAIVNEVAIQLAAEDWHVLAVTGADFLKNTVYLGEWQTRVLKLVDEIKQPRKIALYLPNIESLGTIGKTSKTDVNVADTLLPFISRGELAVIGESTEEAFREGLGTSSSLRRVFQTISVDPADSETTRRILVRVAEDSGTKVKEPVFDQLLELSECYGSPSELPGRAAELLKRSLEKVPSGGELTETDLFSTIQQMTGVPMDLLDDRIKLDRAAVQSFFESRVMGQSEAVNAAVDFVMLIKAGLTDPRKPQGVLMFVGPTGVGKTELARALAEYCFGDPQRLFRFDMSEYATWEAPAKLLGAYREKGVLTSAIREQPFSIILLDEIEKAHSSVFDLCLQLFDAGRLTDGAGGTADFRRALIILTSNIGSKISQQPAIGFEKSASTSDIDHNLRRLAKKEMHRFFRPEFLNRIDRTIHFSPLSQETAQKIAERELAQVLQRGGIRRRKLTVEIDLAIIPHLLQEGYSQFFGARPLKRTIERMVLLPLARMIASGKAPPGSAIRIGIRGGLIKPRLLKVDEQPDLHEPDEAGVLPLLPAERLEQLLNQLGEFKAKLPAIEVRKQSLMREAEKQRAGGQREAWQRTHDEVFRLDGIVSQARRFESSLNGLQETLGQRQLRQSFLSKLPYILEELELDTRFLERLLGSQSGATLTDAIVSLTLLEQRGGDLDGVARLAKMFSKFAERQSFKVQVLDDQRRTQPRLDTVTLLVEGAGAHLLLAGETGRHVLLHGREKDAKRESIQVQVLPVPADSELPQHSELGTEIKRLRGEGERFTRRKLEVKLFHPSSMVSIRAWTDCEHERAVTWLMPWLAARIAAAQRRDEKQSDSEEQVVRRYRLGPDELVRDARTGVRWGRLDRVLEGALHRFLLR